MLTDLLVLVILVAIFFGISLTAALQGVLNIIFWVIFGCVILYGLSLIPEKEVKKIEPQKRPTKPMKKSTSRAIGWVAFFFVSYLITILFLIIINFRVPSPVLNLVLTLTIPCLPFLLAFIISIIKKHAKRKR